MGTRVQSMVRGIALGLSIGGSTPCVASASPPTASEAEMDQAVIGIGGAMRQCGVNRHTLFAPECSQPVEVWPWSCNDSPLPRALAL